MSAELYPPEVFNLGPSEFLSQKGVDVKKGLTNDEVETALKRDGKNVIPPPPKPFLARCCPCFCDDPVAAGFKNLLPEMVTVVRDGNEIKVEQASLVVNDVVKGRLGSKIPADIRIVECRNLECDISSLTGDSVPKEMSPDAFDGPLLESTNIVFFGCLVVDGSYTGVVIGTGQRTVLGEIAGLITNVRNTEIRGATPEDKKKCRELAESKVALVKEVASMEVLRLGRENKSLVMLARDEFLFTKESGIADGVEALLDRCRSNDIKVVLISQKGDSETKEAAIAAKLIKDSGKVFTATEIKTAMDQNSFSEMASSLVAVSGCTHTIGLSLLKAFQQNRGTVLYIGDNVNDLPALKASDVGVATNDSSDASKSAADVILIGTALSAGIGALLFDD